MKNLSGNSVSRVWRVDDSIYKMQPKSMCDNEVFALERLALTGIVPEFRRINDELIVMERVFSTPITDVSDVMIFGKYVLHSLEFYKVRHGDLTRPHVFVQNNRIRIIDWGESRYWYDPRPDKRREGDDYWLTITMKEILREQKLTSGTDVSDSEAKCEFLARQDDSGFRMWMGRHGVVFPDVRRAPSDSS